MVAVIQTVLVACIVITSLAKAIMFLRGFSVNMIFQTIVSNFKSNFEHVRIVL